MWIKLFKIKVKHYELSLFGSILLLGYYRKTIVKQILLCSGGVIFNLILSLLCLPFKTNEVFKMLIIVNSLMIFINLLIIEPLDGYHLIKMILSKVYEEEYLNVILNRLFIISLIFVTLIGIIFKLYFLNLIVFISFLSNKIAFKNKC